MTDWRDAVRNELHRYRVETGDEVLSLQRFYDFSKERLVRTFPDNDHVEDKMRQQLQELRNRGEVTFLDDQGNYRIEDLHLD